MVEQTDLKTNPVQKKDKVIGVIRLTCIDHRGNIKAEGLDYRGITERNNKMDFDKSLISGSTKLLVLSVLEKGDEYGWGIIMQLSERSDKTFEMREGTLYPVLHALETEGLIVSYEQNTPAGRRRKYYHITDKGQKELARQKEQWESFSRGVDRVLGQGAFA